MVILYVDLYFKDNNYQRRIAVNAVMTDEFCQISQIIKAILPGSCPKLKK